MMILRVRQEDSTTINMLSSNKNSFLSPPHLANVIYDLTAFQYDLGLLVRLQ